MQIECWLAKDGDGRVYAFTGSVPEGDSSDGEVVFFIAAKAEGYRRLRKAGYRGK